MIKKLFTVIISILLLSSCSNRNSYYVLSFDDYSLAVGYDDVDYLKLVFTVDSDDKMQPKELRENVDVSFWNSHFAYMDIINYKNREIDIDKAIVCKADIYLSNLEMETFKINGMDAYKYLNTTNPKDYHNYLKLWLSWGPEWLSVMQ